VPGPSHDRFCVVGLGNPGEGYERTRHNVGFLVVDAVAARLGTDIRRLEYQALTAAGFLGRTMVLLMKPQTYMNSSGRSAAAALRDLGISPERLVAVYDDLDLPLGRLRVRGEGGAGGHRGVASLIAELGTETFPRVRVGIGRPPAGCPVIDYVLSPFRDEEREGLERVVRLAADAVETMTNDGVVAAMGAFNGR
jgi:peptidyl-tRNA hydrolase, PTH1 family